MDLVNGHEVIWVQEAGIADSKWLSKACVQVQEPCVSLEVLPFFLLILWRVAFWL